ncbi:peptidase M23-like protein [Homoserinimonas aerilata]|uniref:Peptidase M23-like protein n=1 Tax=Homoserinimonas aerilata TaxID=1162970 RepID=A0A542YI06_9MICO|nr:peptidase M23-like protein [Homoserinimonas aerilata]
MGGARIAAVVMVLASALLAVTTAVPVQGAEAATHERWLWPVDKPHPVLRAYLAPATPYSAGHRGIDIGVASGAEPAQLRAPTDGIVHFAGVVVDRPVLSIRHAGGLVASYEPVVTELVAGDTVQRGDLLGELAGPVTHCDRPCLHFGVRLHGDYVSPLLYLEGIPRSVLLPTRASPAGPP